ncbi:MAG: hypothetical protein E5X67_10080 [Mesorhizobium sp.]|uniref:hypothetical protein n=1 Tax=Mesorhizobium sp. TaxID=1871066 RepID=UPI00122346A3|nr:hypothetical protein [Mesorhizobium sp.]TIP28760.1 MAG: hypothetical protein E5X67_10080 [Mesorhizobium sp.]
MQMMGLWDGSSVPRIGIGTWAAVASRAGVTLRPSMARRRLQRGCTDVALLHINEYPIERAGEVFGTLKSVAPGGPDRRLLARGRNRVAISDCLAVAEFHCA